MTRFLSFAVAVALGLSVLAVGFGPVGTAVASPSQCDDMAEYDTQDAYKECLRDNTTDAELQDYIHTHPANLSQKQIDAVYAIKPTQYGSHGLNETHVTDWMMWEKVGIRPGWFEADASGPTPSSPTTPTTTATAVPTEVEETTPTATPTSTATPAPNQTGSDGVRIDQYVTLRDWTYSAGTFTLTFHSDRARPTVVTITEATQQDEGASRFSYREERLLKGTTTITMKARQNGGEAALGITTQASRAAGHGTSISTGAQGSNPFDSFGGTSGVLSGVGLAIVMSAAAAGWVLWREETGVIEA